MKTIAVPVSFTGTVTVKVPEHLTEEQAKILAGKIAGAKVLATTNNPDAPEDRACEEFAGETNIPEEAAEAAWDQSQVEGADGEWTTYDPVAL